MDLFDIMELKYTLLAHTDLGVAVEIAWLALPFLHYVKLRSFGAQKLHWRDSLRRDSEELVFNLTPEAWDLVPHVHIIN